MRRIGVIALIFTLLSAFATAAQDFQKAPFNPTTAEHTCPPRHVDQTKPSLTGKIENPARALGLTWRSAAGNSQSRNSWVIDQSLCNTGRAALIVEWRKADISNDAHTPLLPGNEMVNIFGLGDEEPVAGDTELKYGGYTSNTAQTKIYMAQSQQVKASGPVFSFVGGKFAFAETFPASAPDMVAMVDKQAQLIDLQVLFQATPSPKGYRFTVVPKTKETFGLKVAVSSSQNFGFVEALERSGFRAQIDPLTKIVSNASRYKSLEAFLKSDFVVFPVGEIGKPLVAFDVEGKAETVELATVVLLSRNGLPLMVGKASIFR